jgi:hypothetical protein
MSRVDMRERYAMLRMLAELRMMPPARTEGGPGDAMKAEFVARIAMTLEVLMKEAMRCDEPGKQAK